MSDILYLRRTNLISPGSKLFISITEDTPYIYQTKSLLKNEEYLPDGTTHLLFIHFRHNSLRKCYTSKNIHIRYEVIFFHTFLSLYFSNCCISVIDLTSTIEENF